MTLFKAFAAVIAGASLLLQAATAHSTQRNALSRVSRLDDPIIQTPSHRVHALSSFEITFRVHDKGQKVRLTLDPNHDIISPDAAVQIMGADGKVRRIEPIDRLEHKIFRGSAFVQLDGQAEWTNAGWARINVHRDGSKPIFEGAFTINGNHHHIQSDENYRKTMIAGDPLVDFAADAYMVVWRDSDILPDSHQHTELKRDPSAAAAGCTSDQLLYNRDENNLVYRSVEEDVSVWSLSPRALFGRQMDGTAGGNGAGVNLANSIGSTAGCPSTRKVALVGIATDCTYTAQFNSTSAVRQNVIQQVNTASQVYESTFNISLGIQNLTISEAECPSSAPASAPWNVKCSGSTSITDRLNLFSTWRGQWKDNNAYWTLLSTCNTGSAVGLAWLGQVCQTGTQSGQNETISGANVVVRTSTEWLVFAHETGHTFGAVHDCTSSTCADGTVTKQQCCPLTASGSSCDARGQFIMNPSTGQGITKFSPCSIGNICSFLGRYSSRVQCLSNNRDVPTITGSQCGNGIVEAGEDCDCGGASGCANNPCCNPTTCKFTTNSVCDFSNEECCTQQCQFKSAGTVCRASTGVCDPEETCSGTSPACPADRSADDGTSCGDSGANLQCASGQCTSRDQQCKTLMGSLTTNNDTYSCSSQGCMLSCASPQFGRNTCYTMQQFFLDGTPCEGGGRCSNGNCQGSNLGKQIGNWFTENQNIVIPVASVVGGLIAIAILSCCITSFCRRRRAKRIPKTPSPAWNYGPMPGGMAPGQPPMGMAGARGMPPPYPGGPAPGGPNQPGAAWEPMRSRSFRYA
ncbi:Disintegrin and metallo proteinase domain-containing protein B [Echria macrotheca]|uniref:Disintegrin and metalloproteinase domain-containing protein B n=1 Tax=Echria macrotheca TaxID=438768 RepID=A0AAJ0FGV1_9PEZI|nr:Disintegrin and metallo proteinase domain-containing protein B [Echria macrotheca]